MKKSGLVTEIVLLALFLGVVATSIFFDEGIGLNYPLYVFLAVSVGLFFMFRTHRNIRTGESALIIGALFFSIMVFVRSSDLLTFLNVIGSIVLLLLVARAFIGEQYTSFHPGEYVRTLFLPVRFIAPFFRTISEFFALRTFFAGHPRRREVTRGILMSLIALSIFGWLFSSADAVFHSFISKIFDIHIGDTFIPRTIFTTIITAFFIGAFGYIFNTMHPTTPPQPAPPAPSLGLLESSILLGSVNVLFLGFILLQATYLFGGTENALPDGLTYAEYARSGFGELVAVAFLAYLLLSGIEKRIRTEGERHLPRFRYLGTALIILVSCILFSAFTRLALYESAYGFTTIRLYSHAFILWIGVASVLLVVHIWGNSVRSVLALRLFSSLMALLLVMNVLNPDVFIARANLERYAKTGEIDARYLGELSTDALPYTIHVLDHADVGVRGQFADGLYWRYELWTDSPERAPRVSTWKNDRYRKSKTEELINAKRQQILTERISPVSSEILSM